MISGAVKPKGFLKRLKNFDRYLDLEFMPGKGERGHWCVIDTARLVAVFPRKTAPGIIQHKKVYDRIYHIPAFQPLNDVPLKHLRERRIHNWQSEKDYKQNYQKQVDTGEERKEKDKMNTIQGISTSPSDLKRFGVVVPGFKQMPEHTGKSFIYGS